MEQSPIVEIKDLKKVIGGKAIIKGISFDIYPGEVFGFLGPNGAGKTTTIRMMVGLMKISNGEVFINGNSIKTNFEKAIAHVGGIVENPEMYKFLSGYHNLVHYARMNEGVTKERIQEVIRLVGLEKRIQDKVRTYSLGMRQRLGLAQALLHSPSLLILDEPTNGLDPAGIREFRDHLRKIAKEEEIAIMVSSHLLSEIEQMCDRIGIIQNGELIDVQSIDNFVKDENVTVVFQVDPMKKADEYFIQKEIKAEIMEKGIKVSLPLEEIPEVAAEFVKREMKIYGIMHMNKTLEDKFLEVTGGNEIV